MDLGLRGGEGGAQKSRRLNRVELFGVRARRRRCTVAGHDAPFGGGDGHGSISPRRRRTCRHRHRGRLLIAAVEALRQLRAEETTREIAVMAMTASVMTEDRQKIMAAGFDGYQSKPINMTDLSRPSRSSLHHCQGARPVCRYITAHSANRRK